MNRAMIIKDVLKEAATPIGNNTDGDLVGLLPEDRVGNLLMLGNPGTGKTFTLTNIVISDIYHGVGGILIDPFRDVVENTLKHIPEEKRNKTADFDLQAGTLEENISRFEKEIHWSEMQKDPAKFLLVRLNIKDLDEAMVKDFGTYLVDSFFDQVGTEGKFAGRSLVIDEAQNFISNRVGKIKNSAGSDLKTILVANKLTSLGSMFDDLAASIKHVMCFAVDSEDAEMLTSKIDVGVTAEELVGIEKFHFYALLNEGGQNKNLKLAGVHPLSFPEV